MAILFYFKILGLPRNQFSRQWIEWNFRFHNYHVIVYLIPYLISSNMFASIRLLQWFSSLTYNSEMSENEGENIVASILLVAEVICGVAGTIVALFSLSYLM